MYTFDVAVLGAGIVGAACAAALAREGLNVVVIDKNPPGTGTTAAGMGHIVVMDDSEAQLALTSYSQQLWADLAEEMPAACEYEECGTIWVAADDEEMVEVRRKHELYGGKGLRTEIIDARGLRQLEPNLSAHLVGGLLVHDDTVVYQSTATKFLLDRATDAGAQLRSGMPVNEITFDGVLLADGTKLLTNYVVNAAGADAPKLSPSLNIRRRKGHLVISDRYPGFVRHQLVELGYLKSAHGSDTSSVAFNVQPRATGQVLVGSSRQFDIEHDEIDHEILRRMTARAFTYMPALRALAGIRVWTGFRPATPDNLPYIGKVPGQENVFAAAGHEGLGITTSLATARLLTAEIMGRSPAIPMEPYSPSRTFTEH